MYFLVYSDGREY